MAIGTAAAIGLGVAGLGSALGSRSQSKAAGKAADVSLQVAQQNNALARDIYGQNKDILNPYVQRGNAAGSALNALLGLGGTPAQQPVQQAPNALAQFQGANPDTSAFNGRFARPFNLSEGAANDLYYNPNMSMAPQGTMYAQNMFGAPTMQNTAVPQGATVPGVSAQQAANDAFATFKQGTGYQNVFNEAMRGVNASTFGAGFGQSGAALMALQDRAGQVADGTFMNYANMLGNQQGTGLGAGSALAGVGQNYVNTISANNNSAGSAAANAALIKGQNNPFASILGTVGGGILGRGF